MKKVMKRAEHESGLEILTDEQYEELEKNPQLLKQWKGYFYKIAYEIVTEESAQEGDVEERGWEVEKSSAQESLEGLLNEVGRKASWLEWSSSRPESGDWIISEAEQDMHTGAYMSYDLFIERGDGKPLSKNEMQYISRALGIRTASVKGNNMSKISNELEVLASFLLKQAEGELDEAQKAAKSAAEEERNKEMDKKFVEEFKTLDRAVVYISADGKNIITWMGTPLGKVLSMKARSNNFMSRSDTGEKLYSLKAKDNNGRLWFGTTHGPGMYARIKVKKSSKEASISNELEVLASSLLKQAKSDLEYERDEAQRHQKQMKEVKDQALADRKENASAWLNAMKKPAIVGERIGWLLDGNYGYGAMKQAENILAQSARANKIASLSVLIAALEWRTPNREAIAMWKKLSPEEKKNLNNEIEKAIKSYQEDKEADATWELQHGSDKKQASSAPKIKTLSDVVRIIKDGPHPHFFDRDTMKSFGDTMKNFGLRRDGDQIIVYRKRPTIDMFGNTIGKTEWVFDPEKKTLIRKD